MTLTELIDWQWRGYPRYHQSRGNLLLHIGAVPAFLAGNVAVLAALFTGPGNAAMRIMLEQWLTFPRFVLTGEWLRALRQSSSS